MEDMVFILHVETGEEKYLLNNETIKSELSKNTKITLFHSTVILY